MTASITKYFTNFGLQTIGFLQPQGSAFADSCQNFRSQITDGLEKRQGFQAKMNGIGGYGAFDFTYPDINGSLIEEKILIDSNLHRIKSGTLNITYTGTSPRATVSVKVSSGQFVLTVVENDTTLLTRSLGQGFDESSSETIAATSAAIDALASFSSTVTGTSTISSAFLDITPELSVPRNSTKTINFFYPESVRAFVASPMDGLTARIGTSDVSNADWTNHNGEIVITDGAAPKVYDGGAVYLAGLPPPSSPLFERLSSGHLNDTYTYYITYGFTDFQGKITESSFSTALPIKTANNKIYLSLPSLSSISGYNTAYATVNGNQTLTPVNNLVTITVNSGHTLIKGDNSYFNNIHTDVNDYRQYIVDSVTATTITVQTTENVQVSSGCLISNGLIINIYRSASLQTFRYLIASVPNDPRGGVQYYTDDLRFAVVSGAQTVSSINGTYTITVSSGGTFKNNDVVIIDASNIGGDNPVNTVLTVNAVSTTSVVLNSATDVDLVFSNGDILLLSDLSYPSFSGSFTARRHSPPDADNCTSYKGTLILSKNSLIFWSDEREPIINNSSFSFDQVSFIDRYSRPIRKLEMSGDSLLIFQDNRIDRLTSSDLSSTDISRSEVSVKLGTVSHTAVIKTGSRLFFLDKSGVFEINNGVMSLNRQSSLGEQLAVYSGLGGAISYPIKTYFDGSVDIEWERASLAVDPQHNYLFVNLPMEPTGSPGYNKSKSVSFLYEMDKDRWYQFSNWDFSGGVIVDSDFNFFFVERQYGKSRRINLNQLIRREDSHGFNDHVSPISASYETKYDVIVSDAAVDQKNVEEVKLYNVRRKASDYLHEPTVSCTIYKDYENIIQSTFDYSFPTEIDGKENGIPWGFMWNNTPFGSWKAPFEKNMLIRDSIESLKIRFQNSEAGVNCKITGWAVKTVFRPILMKQ